jgi:hypothetical protein
MDRFDQQQCSLLIFPCIFVIASLFLFFGVFVPLAVMNRSYQEGICYGAKGRADQENCEYKVCWSVYQGVTAVTNVTAYVWKGFYLNHNDVVQIVDGNIGKNLGKCWYKFGGTEIIMRLHNSEAILFISLAILSVAVFTCIIIVATICREKKLCKKFKIPKCCKKRNSAYTESESVPLI